MYLRPALSSEYIRPARSAGSSMLCCSLPCGRREWRELRQNWESLICHAGGLWKWLTLVNHCIYYACQTCKIYKVLPCSLHFGELWNPLSKTVLNKCGFIWNKGPVNILKKLKNDLHVGFVNIFPNFLDWYYVCCIPEHAAYLCSPVTSVQLTSWLSTGQTVAVIRIPHIMWQWQEALWCLLFITMTS